MTSRLIVNLAMTLTPATLFAIITNRYFNGDCVMDSAWPFGFGMCCCGCGRKSPVAETRGSGRRAGDLLPYIRNHRRRIPLEARFWAKVRIGRKDECWEWNAHRYWHGYGAFQVGATKSTYAHRMAYTLENGPIPDGLKVLHRCDNRACCNPGHLFLGTQADNMADCAAKGRYADQKGVKHPLARLTDSDVIAIRQRHEAGEGHQSIARDYGVTRQAIYRIVTRRAWAHI